MIKTKNRFAGILYCLLLMLAVTNVYAQNPADFTLTSVTDKSSFTLSNAKGKYVVLHFLLKTECPYCIRHTRDYFEKSATLPDVVQVFIKPDTEAEIKEWAIKLSNNSPLKQPIYRDPDAALAEKLGIPGGYSFHGQTVHYPALIILDKEGREIFRYVGKNNTDRYSFEKLVQKMSELK